MIAIVTESLSCMNLSDCAAYGISLAPLDCVMGEELCRDRILTAEQALAEGEGHSLPPSEESYRTRFEVLLRDFDGVLCITASRKFSDSNRHATLAAASFGGRVQVVDSGSVAGGLFLLVLRARHLITLGYPMSRIKAELEAYKNTLRVSFTTESVTPLREAKRLSAKAPVGNAILSRRPIFRIEGGGIGLHTHAPSGLRAVESLLSVFEGERRPPSHLAVHYANRTEELEYLLLRLRELYPSATVYERPITLSIQLNLGCRILGVVGD